MSERFAFLDTSILLHYRPFDEVDWLSVLDAGSVNLVVAPITIAELNEKKDEPTSKRRQRAASSLKKLEVLWSKGNPAQVRQGVKLLLQEVEPSIDYAAHQLDYRSQDDRLLASIIHFTSLNSGAAIVLITADFGLRVKARGHGIETMCLPEELKLPDEPDPNEKRIQQLERELLELKRVMPDLQLLFSGESSRLEVSLEPPVTSTRDEIEREQKMIRLKHKKWGEEPEPKEETPQLRLARALTQLPDFFRPSKEAINRYNADLEKFYTEYDAWLTDKASVLNWEQRMVRLDLVLINKGTSPAEDIDLFFDFPDGFHLYTANDLPRRPAEPKPPEKPAGGIAGALSSSFPSSFGLGLHNLTLPSVGPRNVSSPRIRRTNSYEVNIHVKELKHNLLEGLPPLYVVFDSYENTPSFGIEYRILAANMPKPVSGQLHVIVRKRGAEQVGTT